MIALRFVQQPKTYLFFLLPILSLAHRRRFHMLMHASLPHVALTPCLVSWRVEVKGAGVDHWEKNGGLMPTVHHERKKFTVPLPHCLRRMMMQPSRRMRSTFPSYSSQLRMTSPTRMHHPQVICGCTVQKLHDVGYQYIAIRWTNTLIAQWKQSINISYVW